jgi:hypothetical protein
MVGRLAHILTAALVLIPLTLGVSRPARADEATPAASAGATPSAVGGRFTGLVDIGGRSL